MPIYVAEKIAWPTMVPREQHYGHLLTGSEF
jgi:hypothetical protein